MKKYMILARQARYSKQHLPGQYPEQLPTVFGAEIVLPDVVLDRQTRYSK